MNTITLSDCLAYLKTLPDESIDVLITSPPYAEQRKHSYDGIVEADFAEWFRTIGEEVKRVLKPTGSFILNIKEHARKGKRSTYVLETVLLLSKILFWNETFIWNKANPYPTGNKRRLKDGFEYCYMFTKTTTYKFFPEAVLIPSTSKYLESEKRRTNKGEHNVTNGSGFTMKRRYVADMVRPSNVLTLAVDTTNHEHPATFPIELPEFFIKLLSEEGDVILDIFAGSGTTLCAAQRLKRCYLGCDIKAEYVAMAEERLKEQIKLSKNTEIK